MAFKRRFGESATGENPGLSSRAEDVDPDAPRGTTSGRQPDRGKAPRGSADTKRR
jgi:hypothetical protein